jgi:Flp pilus assembly pilin Flp
MRKWRSIGGWTRGLIVLFREEEGQALAEYSLILAFVFIACVIALGALGLALAGHLGALATAFS